MKNLFSKIIIASFFLFALPAISTAQPDGGEDLDNPDNNIPLDGGLSILLVAGASLAGKKALDYRKAKKQNEQKGNDQV